MVSHCAFPVSTAQQIGHRDRWGRRALWITACIEIYIDRDTTRAEAAAAAVVGTYDSASGAVDSDDADCSASSSAASVGGPRKSRRLAAADKDKLL